MSHCAGGKEMGPSPYIEMVDNLLVNITADGATLQRGSTKVIESLGMILVV